MVKNMGVNERLAKLLVMRLFGVNLFVSVMREIGFRACPVA